MQPLNSDFRIGPWHISPRRNIIRNTEGPRHVEPKVMQVLLCLAEHQGESVSREDLIQDVWSGAHTTDDVVTRTISRLREALDDDYRQPQYIETVRKIGYRLIPLPEPVSSPQRPTLLPPPSLPRDRHRSAPWRMSLALLVVLSISLGYVWHNGMLPAPSPRTSIATYPLTSLPGIESDPALSPNGEMVAFIWHGGPADNVFNLYTQTLDTHTLKQLTASSDRDHHPAWSPDGQHIAFLRSSETHCHIMTVRVSGGEAQVLTPCPSLETTDLAWSPDGQYLALASRTAPDKPYGLRLIDLSTLTNTSLTTPSDFFGDIQPAFSPDGQWIAFQRSVDGAFVGDVFRIPASGGEPVRLTHRNRLLFGLSWTPDSEAILFSSSGPEYTFGLWQVSKEGDVLTERSDFRHAAGHPSLALHRNRMVFTVQSYDTNIWALPLADEASSPLAPTRLSQSTHWDGHPHVSAVGNQVAFATRRTGKTEIWTRSLTGGPATRLVAMPEGLAQLPQWSPHGQKLVVEVRNNETADLYVTDAQGNFPKRLTHDSHLEVSPTWSRDGDSIYFASNRTGAWQIWKISSDGGSATQVTTGGGIRAQESADGSTLFFTKPETPGIWQKTLPEGSETLLLDLPPPADWGNWIAAEEGIYFAHHHNDAPTLSFFDFATEHIQPLYTPEQPLLCSFPGMALSSDHQMLLFTQVDRHDRDLMWAEFTQ